MMTNSQVFSSKGMQRVAALLYRESIIHRWFRVDDRVKILQHSPLGMFFYNQRALFFGCSGLFLVALFLYLLIAPPDSSGYREMAKTFLVLFVFWGVGVTTTLALHARFLRQVRIWVKSPPGEMIKGPPIFGIYFLIDFVVVLVMILVGRHEGITLDAFALLLMANTIVYSAYVGGGRGYSLLVTAALFLLLMLTFPLFQVVSAAPAMSTHWFHAALVIAPLVGMFLITIFSVSIISWLRRLEHEITQRQLQLLGKYETVLSGTAIRKAISKRSESPKHFDERRFRSLALEVLQDLCSLGEPFWYRAACLWFVENHQDLGERLLPGPSVNFDEVNTHGEGIDAKTGMLATDEFRLVTSLRYKTERMDEHQPRFFADLNAPAAFVPLHRGEARIGVLALYGEEGGPPPQRQEGAFLRSLGTIICNTMEQWEGRYKDFPQREMDGLFECKSLKEVFDRGVGILTKYLMAEGCMIIFRPEPTQKEMFIKATQGFGKEIYEVKYEAGRGQTGGCSARGVPIRCDDVSKHRDEFDASLLKALEDAHGRSIVSWMAIPIGSGEENFGVIKVVNSTFRCGWFTDGDQELGEKLALRLHAIIEKFLQIETTEVARAEAAKQAAAAEREALDAQAAREDWKNAATQRQMDLMKMTHQLQGPLIPVIGVFSRIQKIPMSPQSRNELELAKALAEACLVLCWGITTTFAQAAGQQTAFEAEDIDAPAEMRKLVRVLQLANSRPDLEFRFWQDPNFPPTVRMDKNVFINVLFSLVHNAMKYADEYTEVWLECSFESGKLALKVNSEGEPIYSNETGRIFERFERGRSVENSSRKHSGTGLGLWVARELMTGVNGNLTVELSPRNPRRAIFIVHLPTGT